MSENTFDLFWPDKDQLMLWADRNIRDIFLRFFPDLPESVSVKTTWFDVRNSEDEKTYVIDMEARAFLYDDSTLNLPREPGTAGTVRYYSATMYLVFYQIIPSIGEAIREVNELRAALRLRDKPWALVSSYDRYAELLEQQKIHFVEAPKGEHGIIKE